MGSRASPDAGGTLLRPLGQLLPAAVLALGGALSVAPAPAPAPGAPAGSSALSPEVSLLLVGDGGDPRVGGEPVLRALSAEASLVPARTTVVFLGDNVYPRGIPPNGDPSRREAERRLGDQVRAARSGGARAIFVPGNHDWSAGGPSGAEAVSRQETLISSLGGGRAVLLPGKALPGPAVVDLGETLRLVLLDTQWFLQNGPRPEPDAEPWAALQSAIAGAGRRRVVVAAHHPLLSGGPHGAPAGVLDHLFPFRQLAPWAWLPLPVIGSVYPLARSMGAPSQDAVSPQYVRLAAGLKGAFRPRAPLIYASGHDHGLQLLRGDTAAGEPRWQVVSGGGYLGSARPTRTLPATAFARESAGFFRVDVFPDRSVLAKAIVVSSRETSAAWSGRLD